MHSKGRGGSGPKWARAPACVQFPVAVVAIFRARNFLQSTQLYNGGLVSIGKPHAQLSLSPLAVLEFRDTHDNTHIVETYQNTHITVKYYRILTSSDIVPILIIWSQFLVLACFHIVNIGR